MPSHMVNVLSAATSVSTSFSQCTECWALLLSGDEFRHEMWHSSQRPVPVEPEDEDIDVLRTVIELRQRVDVLEATREQG